MTLSIEQKTGLISEILGQDACCDVSAEQRSMEILLCMEGTAEITDLAVMKPIKISKGVSLAIPASVRRYEILGQAVLYKASIPLQPADFGIIQRQCS